MMEQQRTCSMLLAFGSCSALQLACTTGGGERLCGETSASVNLNCQSLKQGEQILYRGQIVPMTNKRELEKLPVPCYCTAVVKNLVPESCFHIESHAALFSLW